MANDNRGTKREDPENGKKFYDLNKDPIVSPYTGKSYPRSYFEQVTAPARRAPDARKRRTRKQEVEEVAAPTNPR